MDFDLNTLVVIFIADEGWSKWGGEEKKRNDNYNYILCCNNDVCMPN